MYDKEFKKWLIDKGYKEFTPKGLPSTATDYVNRIRYVIWYERLFSWQEVVNNIDRYLLEYDKNGAKALIGKKSHNAVICALKRFKEFLNDKY